MPDSPTPRGFVDRHIDPDQPEIRSMLFLGEIRSFYMLTKTRQSVEGRKTYIMAGAMFVFALASVMNGWGDAQMSAGIAGIAAAFAATRAGIDKNNGGSTVKLLALMGLSLFLLGGCAGLGTVDPQTGTSPAQDIVAAIASGASLFGPVVGTAVPTAVAAVLAILIAGGKAKANTPPIPE